MQDTPEDPEVTPTSPLIPGAGAARDSGVDGQVPDAAMQVANWTSGEAIVRPPARRSFRVFVIPGLVLLGLLGLLGSIILPPHSRTALTTSAVQTQAPTWTIAMPSPTGAASAPTTVATSLPVQPTATATALPPAPSPTFVPVVGRPCAPSATGLKTCLEDVLVKGACKISPACPASVGIVTFAPVNHGIQITAGTPAILRLDGHYHVIRAALYIDHASTKIGMFSVYDISDPNLTQKAGAMQYTLPNVQGSFQLPIPPNARKIAITADSGTIDMVGYVEGKGY